MDGEGDLPDSGMNTIGRRTNEAFLVGWRKIVRMSENMGNVNTFRNDHGLLAEYVADVKYPQKCPAAWGVFHPQIKTNPSLRGGVRGGSPGRSPLWLCG